MMNGIIQHNHELMRQQHELLAKVPNSLKLDSSRRKSEAELVLEARQETERQYKDLLRQLDESKVVSI